MSKVSNIPIFIPHLGCKNACVFCNQREITGNLKEPEADEVRAIIEEYLTFLKDREAQIAFFGGSFTGLHLEKQTEYLKVAYEFVKNGKVSGIRLSTRPDYISEEILENLKKYGVKTIELGAQSMCDEVLLASERGHTADDTRRASEMIKNAGFELGLQMMIGLPGDTRERSVYTAQEIVKLGAACARIYPTCVLTDTKLYDMYKSGEYKPLGLSEAVETAKEVTLILRSGGVDVIRTGLQETDSLCGSIAAGPYHPAFGEMVQSRIIRDELEEKVISMLPTKEMTLPCKKNMVSKTVGQKRCNIAYLEEKYGVKINITVI
ncbi:MAG: radical SAM protein [Clostridia bacterium]|nr:radical SAM protein [Clostridia bacterium]